MYGDNKANERPRNLLDIKLDTSNLDTDVYTVLSRAHSLATKEDILFLAQKSQEITDALNALYEQMKGN